MSTLGKGGWTRRPERYGWEITGEKMCPRCKEQWPADEEFFRKDHRGDHPRLHSWCRACEAEQKHEYRERVGRTL